MNTLVSTKEEAIAGILKQEVNTIQDGTRISEGKLRCVLQLAQKGYVLGRLRKEETTGGSDIYRMRGGAQGPEDCKYYTHIQKSTWI